MNMRRKLTVFSKTLLVLGLFLIISGSIIVKTAGSAASPSLLFSDSSKAVGVGEIITVDIILDTAGQEVHGAGAKITFDQKNLEIVSIQPGTIFGDYPVASYDNTSGNIIVSGIASSKNNSFNDSGVFATLTFRAIKEGDSSVQFIFEPGSTRDSNIAVTYGTGDILSNVGTLSITVTPGTGITTSLPIANGFQPATTENLNFFEKLLRFFGLSTPAFIRDGRSKSRSIDAYQPLPSQPSITDPSQKQPLSFIGSNDDSLFTRLVLIFLTVALFVGLVLLIKRFLLKPSSKKATVFQNIDNSQDNRL